MGVVIFKSRDTDNTIDPQPSEYYYMLTEDLPEDKKLRQEIHLKKLVSKVDTPKCVIVCNG